MPSTPLTIAPEERTLAAITHLSGLAGYVIPLGGIVVPIVIWMVKSESPVISTIAKQAIWLNVAVFLCAIVSVGLFFTIILAPVSIVAWIVLALVAIIFPIVGAIKAHEGAYYRYPVVGLTPSGLTTV
jgi:uncharacterized Tic20 family protein